MGKGKLERYIKIHGKNIPCILTCKNNLKSDKQNLFLYIWNINTIIIYVKKDSTKYERTINFFKQNVLFTTKETEIE